MNRKITALLIVLCPFPALAEDRDKVSDEQRAIREQQEAIEEFVGDRMDEVDEVLELYDGAVDPAERRGSSRGAARGADRAVEGTTESFRSLYEDAIRNQMRYYGN